MAAAVFTINLESALAERLAEMATAQHSSPAALITTAVTEYLEQQKRRHGVYADALAASQHFDETGLHLTGQEADAWLQQLEEGQDVPFPACHP